MEDKELYKEFLNGNDEALNQILTKYRNNLIYFITRYTKNIEASEDILQDVIVYILEKKEVYNEKYSLKTYLYTIAKSRALNYIKKEKHHTNIEDILETKADTKILEEIICNNEREQKIKETIGELKTDYQIVLYLTQIEGLSYKETAIIMGKTTSQIKTLAHNAKKRLKEELKKEGVVDMKNGKLVKILLLLLIIIGISGLTYGVSKLYKHYKNANLNGSFSGSTGNANENNVWVGTFQMAWNDLLELLKMDKIEFSGGTPKLAEELNKKNFTKDQISEKDYYSVTGLANETLRKTMENELQTRFNERSSILDRVDWNSKEEHYVIYSMLKKEFTFKVPFPKMRAQSFGGSTEKVKYFGLEDSTMDETFDNVEALFYNSKNDFAVKIKTVEGEELLLYRTDSDKSFEEIYNEMLKKASKYNGRKILKREQDKMKVPFIKVNADINYDELCNKYIKGTELAYIKQAVQTVDFELDNYGGYVRSEAIINMYQSLSDKEQREFYFTDKFVLFMKEEGKEKPYFALKVNNTDVLVEEENN